MGEKWQLNYTLNVLQCTWKMKNHWFISSELTDVDKKKNYDNTCTILPSNQVVYAVSNCGVLTTIPASILVW